MHTLGLPQNVVDMVTARRGRRFAYGRLEPKRTALLVIDLQNAFMRPGMGLEVPVARAIVPNVNRLAAAARSAGATVVWVQIHLSRSGGADWPHFFDELNSPERSRQMLEDLADGSDGHALWPELDVRPGDLVSKKNRFSAFIEGSSDLPAVLAARGIDTVVITGTLTNNCCEASARDAAMRNLRTVMVSDACAAVTDADHQSSLINVFRAYGDVMSTDEAIAAIR